VLEIHGETLDILGPGRGEKESLSVWTDLPDDLTNLRLETHVQHAVGLVHDEIGDTLQVGLPAFQHVDQTTRRSDDNLATALEIANLLTFGSTTVNCGISNTRGFAELCALELSLNGKFTGRSENEDNGTVTGCEQGLSVDMNHSGKGEGDGLAGTSLGDGDNVSTRQCHRPSLALNRSGSIETHGADFGHDVFGKASFLEGSDWAGDVAALDLTEMSKYILP